MSYGVRKQYKECKANIALNILREFTEKQREYQILFYTKETEEDYKKVERLLYDITSTKIAMELLDLKDRAIISMRVYDKLQYKQIALNIGTSNKNLCNAGKKMIRDSLVKYYDLFTFVDQVRKGEAPIISYLQNLRRNKV